MNAETLLQVGDSAPDHECQYSDGTHGRLSDLWSQQRLLLAFTRHLGCTFCREQLLDLKTHYSEFQAAGIEVAAVVMRSAEETNPLAEKLELPFRCICDPEQSLYQLYRIRKGTMWQIMGPSIWGRAIRSLMRNGMGTPAGDLNQLHATILIDVGGQILFTHYPKSSAERLHCPAVLDAC